MTMPTAQPVPGTAQQQRQRQQKRPRRKEAPGTLPATAPKGLASIRIHDAETRLWEKHRATGVTEGNRRALLDHKNGSHHQSLFSGGAGKLIDEANKILATDARGPALTILRRKAG
ncbi:hypothetical protein ACGFZ6_12770 [Stutzerimonas stutzeri]|uniref:hypothetical protein n=1 Tax=Stutzerimonas stutzeri TaxID=316 RepID=UPI003719EB24